MSHPFNTFSIIACDPETGLMGGAAASFYPGLGAFSPFVRIPYGVIASQGWVNPFLNEEIMSYLVRGYSAEEALHSALQADRGREWRQVSVVDASGATAAYTGSKNDDIKLHLRGNGYVIAGNLLTGEDVLKRLERVFLETRGQELSHRLMAAMVAADEIGGDRRGKKAAVIQVQKVVGFPYIDFRIDDDENAIVQLNKLYQKNADALIEDYDGWVERIRSGNQGG